MSLDKYEVIVLFDGYSQNTEQGSSANCTCTLLKGPKKVIVDTLTAWDGWKLTNALKEHEVECDDIDYVICTHGHSDHIGCNYLFKNAIHIVGYCISKEHTYFSHNFQDNEYIIDDSLKVVATPGHTSEDVTVLVKSINRGLVAVTGDLFENASDLDDEEIWKESSGYSYEIQKENRAKILKTVDWIIPGHGPIFRVNKI